MTETISLRKSKSSKLVRVPNELLSEINKIKNLVDIEFKKKYKMSYRPTNTQALRIYITANSTKYKYLKIFHKGKSIVLEKR